MTVSAPAPAARWELYRLLSEPVRLRLLALAHEEELAIGELAELLGEGQPNVSRHVGPLRKAGLLSVRKQGTRVLVSLAHAVLADPVVMDGVAAGSALCEADGSLARVPEVVQARDEGTREFFRSARGAREPSVLAPELPAYLTALGPLLSRRRLAVDVGTGPGALLDVLAPIFDAVIAVDREEEQLAAAAQRIAARGYGNVMLLRDAYDSENVEQSVQRRGGADLVFASRVLHHAPRPKNAVRALAKLLAPGGALAVIDYLPHEQEEMREREADLWLGFERDELARFAQAAGLAPASCQAIAPGFCGDGPDSQVPWQVFVARKPC